MNRSFLLAVFLFAAVAFAVAQQSSGAATGSAGQSSSSMQTPSTGQTSGTTAQGQSSTGSATQTQSPAGAPSGAPNAMTSGGPVTEGCLSGTNPNFTITDRSGTTYKLNIPPGADGSVLKSHVGESVQVAGPVTAGAIDVNRVARGTGTCGNKAGGAAAPQK